MGMGEVWSPSQLGRRQSGITRHREDPSSRLKILAKMLQNGVHHVQ